jgi:micrococcal nuclease
MYIPHLIILNVINLVMLNGRLLFYVYLEDGRLFQELILQEGLAHIAVYKPDVKYQSHLEAVEQQAKSQNLNLWSNE